MLRILGIAFKFTLFTCLVLVLGQLIHWRGRSVSDQVKTTLASAQRSPQIKKVKRSSQTLLDDARTAIQEQTKNLPGRAAAALNDEELEKASPKKGPPVAEEIPHGEREELNALLDL